MNEPEFLAALRKTRGEWILIREDDRLLIRTKKTPRACPITRLDPEGPLPALYLPLSSYRLKIPIRLVRDVVFAAEDEGNGRLRRKLLAATGLVTAERRLRAKLRREASRR